MSDITKNSQEFLKTLSGTKLGDMKNSELFLLQRQYEQNVLNGVVFHNKVGKLEHYQYLIDCQFLCAIHSVIKNRGF